MLGSLLGAQWRNWLRIGGVLTEYRKRDAEVRVWQRGRKKAGLEEG